MPRKKQNKFDKYFLLSWRKAWIIVVGWFVAVMLHNFISALFNFEDALFFIIAIFLIPIYVVLAIVYSIIQFFRK